MNNKGKINKPVKILFVCLGNICRSPAAQGVMQAIIDKKGASDRFELDSAGLYGGHAGDLPDKRMRVHAIRRGYDLTHISRQVRYDDFEYFDMIIGMDHTNIRNLKEMANSVEEAEKVVPMADFLRLHNYADHIPDPYYEGAEGFENVLDLLEDACQGLYETLTEE